MYDRNLKKKSFIVLVLFSLPREIIGDCIYAMIEIVTRQRIKFDDLLHQKTIKFMNLIKNTSFTMV
jgi:hypothetical protein